MDKLYLLVPVLSQEINRVSREANCFAFGEGDVETGGVIVDELKEEHLQSQAVLVVRLGPRKLCYCVSDQKGFRIKPHGTSQYWAEVQFKLTKVGDPDGDPLIENVEDHNHDKADEGGCDRGGHLRRHILL